MSDESEPPGDFMAALMKDPRKRAMVLQLLAKEKDNFRKHCREELEKKRLHCESPTAIYRKRALKEMQEKQQPSEASSSSDVSEVPSDEKGPPMPLEELLKGVVAFVDVKRDHEDKSEGIKTVMRLMGATIRESFTKDVTHVIFKDGAFSTYEKARLLKKHLVSVLWLDAVRRNHALVPEKNYPAFGKNASSENMSILCSQIQKDYEDVIKDERRHRRQTMAASLAQVSPDITSDESDCGGVVDGHVSRNQSQSLLGRRQSDMVLTPNVSTRMKGWGRKTPEEEAKSWRKALRDSAQTTMSSLRISSASDRTKSGLESVGKENSRDVDKSLSSAEKNSKLEDSNSSSRKIKLLQNISLDNVSRREEESRNVEEESVAKKFVTIRTRRAKKSESKDLDATSAKTRSSVTKNIKQKENLKRSTTKETTNSDVASLSSSRCRRNVFQDLEKSNSTEDASVSKKVTKWAQESDYSNPELEESNSSNKIQEASTNNTRKDCTVNEELTADKRNRRSVSSVSSSRSRRNVCQDLEESSSTEHASVSKKVTRRAQEIDNSNLELGESNSSNKVQEATTSNTRKDCTINEELTANKRNRRSVSSVRSVSRNVLEENQSRLEENSVANKVPKKKTATGTRRKLSTTISEDSRSSKDARMSTRRSVSLARSTMSRNEESNVETRRTRGKLDDRDESVSSKKSSSEASGRNQRKNQENRRVSSSSEEDVGNSLDLMSRLMNGANKELTQKRNIQGSSVSSSSDDDLEDKLNKERGHSSQQSSSEDTEKRRRASSVISLKTKPNEPKRSMSVDRKRTRKVRKLYNPNDFTFLQTDNNQTKVLATPTKKKPFCDPNELKIRPPSEKKAKKKTPTKRKLSAEDSDSDIPKISPIKRRSTLDFVSLSASQQKSRLRLDPKRESSIVGTKMHRYEVLNLQKAVNELGNYYVEDKVTKNTTHLVAAEPKRTINMLRAIARGCWILKHEWLLDSQQAERWLDEEDYELVEFSPAVQKNRLERQAFGSLYRMDIFKDCGFIFIANGTSPAPKDLKELISICKGRVTTLYRKADIVVGEFIDREGVKCVTEKWVLDSIVCNKLRPVKKYFITPE